MGRKKSQVKFDTTALRKQMEAYLINAQTVRLVAYAKETINDIGNAISAYNSRNHMDRTGNLLNSLCWGVAYRGELAESGFYRNASSTRLSYLHEWSKDADYGAPYPVGGHELAEEYIRRYGNANSNGWRVFFAVLAPYWGYWEEGFNLKKARGGTEFRRFAIMTQFYDKVTNDLKPMKTTFKVHVPTYTPAYTIEFSSGRKGNMPSSMSRDYERYSSGKSDPYSSYRHRR